MQNTENNLYINRGNIINIKSEILCREAEDDFFYFNNINAAYKKLNESVKLTPNHIKSIILLADVSFIKGYIRKSLKLFNKAEQMGCHSAKIYASIANCNNVLGNYSEALKNCNKAIERINFENFIIYSQVVEMKINILIQQKQYKKAYITFIKAQNILDKNSLKSIYNISYELLNKKINVHNRLMQSHLKIV
ncbi:hypothetical protein IJ182_05235 [bacterium]|nr:hypothetical protein [bacterium]